MQIVSSKNLRSRSLGLTLVEILVTMALVSILAFVGLSAIKPGVKKGETRGLATAIINEFDAARQLAIKSGQPVAVGIPTNGGGTAAASSVYRIQGWNTPYVTWSANYSGDYPNGGFAAATWVGASGAANTNLTPPASAKFFNFDQAALLAWLPDNTESDYIYCYLPDGSLITNNLPSSDGLYTLVVANNPNFQGGAPSGVSLAGGDNPITITIAPSGGVKMITGCPGGTIGAGTAAFGIAPPQARTSMPANPNVSLSDMNIAPNPVGDPDNGVCVPGQYVNLEIFASSPEGAPLYASWNQTPSGTKYGNFTSPDGQGAAGQIQNEADRMEYISPAERQALEAAGVIRWSRGFVPPPDTGLFRARWSWTVPLDSLDTDVYTVQVAVETENADAQINGGPYPPVTLNPAPKGRLIVERRGPPPGNLWQLWRMNPDGTGARLLSPTGTEETFASIDKFGNTIAFLQGPAGARYVKTRALEGGLETTIAGPGNFTAASISPLGDWVAYRERTAAPGANPADGVLRVTSADLTTTHQVNQSWAGGPNLHDPRKSKPGWSVDSNYCLFGNEQEVQSLDVRTGVVATVSPSVNINGFPERAFAPFAFIAPDGLEYVMFSAGNYDPVLCSFQVTPAMYDGSSPHAPGPGTGMATFPRSPDLNGPGPGAGSGATDDDFPSISPDRTEMIVTRSGATNGPEDVNGQTVVIYRWDAGQGKFYGPEVQTVNGDVRRAIYVPPQP